MPGRLDKKIAHHWSGLQWARLGERQGHRNAVCPREGARIFAVDLSAQNVAETVRIISSEGGEAVSHVADVSRSEQVKALVERCEEVYSR